MESRKWLYDLAISAGGTILMQLFLPQITSIFSSWPIWQLVLLPIGIFLILFGISGAVRGTFTKKSTVEFHEKREALIKRYGGFTTEFAKCKQVWVCAWVGQSIYRDDALHKVNITKIVLHNPEYSELKKYAELDGKNVSLYENTIIELSKQAINKRIPVYWISEPTLGIVIANPEVGDGSGWARIEDFLPYGMPSDSQSYTIHEKERPEFFGRVTKSFNNIIENNRDNLVTEDKLIETEKQLMANRSKGMAKINGFYLEFNDHSMTTKDDRLFLGVNFYSNTEVIVENLQLEINRKRFYPRDWSPFKLKYIHTKNYEFNLSEIRAIASNEWQDAKFIAIVDGAECPSTLFNIHILL